MRGSHLSLYRMMGRLFLSVSDSSSRRPPVAQPLTWSQHRSCGLKSRRHFSVFRSCWEALLTLPLAVRYLQVLPSCHKLHRMMREKNYPCSEFLRAILLADQGSTRQKSLYLNTSHHLTTTRLLADHGISLKKERLCHQKQGVSCVLSVYCTCVAPSQTVSVGP